MVLCDLKTFVETLRDLKTFVETLHCNVSTSKFIFLAISTLVLADLFLAVASLRTTTE
ncbi:MAG: hypothetical protein KME54_09835 [Tolypothrix brevis GSE-NOS-MK-07-07A]|jgi:hypothetical protein|nr:hypothetical protein [Tolypothrix brevis GSE-NOS-MK-07-07A]